VSRADKGDEQPVGGAAVERFLRARPIGAVMAAADRRAGQDFEPAWLEASLPMVSPMASPTPVIFEPIDMSRSPNPLKAALGGLQSLEELGVFDVGRDVGFAGFDVVHGCLASAQPAAGDDLPDQVGVVRLRRPTSNRQSCPWRCSA
jgi:hypothetical protein